MSARPEIRNRNSTLDGARLCRPRSAAAASLLSNVYNKFRIPPVCHALRLVEDDTAALHFNFGIQAQFAFFPWRLLFVVALLFAVTIKAADVSTEFHQANKLYEQGNFSGAATGYENILKSGLVSAPLYFNLGNAYLKSGQIGRAIFSYRQAQKIDPRDPELSANLHYARTQAGGGTASRVKLWDRFRGKLTLNEWTILTSSFVSLWFVLLAIRHWRANGRKLYPATILSLGILCALLVVCLAAAVHKEFYVKSAIVTVPEAVVRRGPFNESQSAFTLRDGTEVTVIGKQSDWLQIVDPTQRTGWLLEKQLILNRQFETAIR